VAPPLPRREPATLAFAVLGPLHAADDDGVIAIGSFKQRTVLGLLLCHPNQTVSLAALNDALWADFPPRTARNTLQVHISALRRILGPRRGPAGVVLRRGPTGYTLQVGADQLDSIRFRDLAHRGRAAARDGDQSRAVDLLDRAIRLWRGPALADLSEVPRLAVEAARLEEQFLLAYEDWAEAKLASGQPAQVLESIDELVRRHPLRERLLSARMLALYRLGRAAEALAQFDAARQLLARDLGLRPSPVLGRLYRSILTGDQALLTGLPQVWGRAA